MSLSVTQQLQLLTEISAAFDHIADALRDLRPLFGADEAFAIISTGLSGDRNTVLRHIAGLIAGQTAFTTTATPKAEGAVQ
jgi:hypothetical protein